MITWEHKETDNINRMSTISKSLTCLSTLQRVIRNFVNPGQFDNINQMATLIGSHYGASTVLQLIKSKLKRFDNVISN